MNWKTQMLEWGLQHKQKLVTQQSRNVTQMYWEIMRGKNSWNIYVHDVNIWGTQTEHLYTEHKENKKIKNDKNKQKTN